MNKKEWKLEKEKKEIIYRRKTNSKIWKEDGYDDYEQRDIKQEIFENLKAQMIKKKLAIQIF